MRNGFADDLLSESKLGLVKAISLAGDVLQRHGDNTRGLVLSFLFSLMQATGRRVNGPPFELLDWLSLVSPIVHHFRLFSSR